MLAKISNRQTMIQKNELFTRAIEHVSRQAYTQAIKAFKRFLDLEPHNPTVMYNIACIYSLQGKKKDAVAWLQKSIANGYKNWEKLTTDKDLENIRHTDGYRRLLEKKTE